jgi:hypothetical protein
MKEVPLLAVEGQVLFWAVPAERVVTIQSEEKWRGRAPFDIARSSGIAVRDDAFMGRVIVVAKKDGNVPLLARGKVVVRSFESSQLLPVPNDLLGGASSIAAHVIFSEPMPLVLLDLDHLHGAHDESTSA